MANQRYQIKLLPEIKAILQADFNQPKRRQIINALYRELTFMPNRYPTKMSRRQNKSYKTIPIEGYSWAFTVKKQLVTIVYAAETWRF